jgi:hypothetical protein
LLLVVTEDLIAVVDDVDVVDRKLEFVVSATEIDVVVVVFVVVETCSSLLSCSLILLSKKTGELKSVPIPAKLREIARKNKNLFLPWFIFLI